MHHMSRQQRQTNTVTITSRRKLHTILTRTISRTNRRRDTSSIPRLTINNPRLRATSQPNTQPVNRELIRRIRLELTLNHIMVNTRIPRRVSLTPRLFQRRVIILRRRPLQPSRRNRLTRNRGRTHTLERLPLILRGRRRTQQPNLRVRASTHRRVNRHPRRRVKALSLIHKQQIRREPTVTRLSPRL